MYATTGNPSPDMNGSNHAGENLFASSIVALDLNTGALRWYFQEVHHGLWDYDAVQPALLFTMHRNGQSIPAIAHANKDGFWYVLDRRTGRPLFKVTEEPVPSEPAWQHPSPTQPIPATEPLIPQQVINAPRGMQSAPMFTPPQERPLLIQPGWESGPEWSPSSYSPRTGYEYIDAGGYEPWLYHTLPHEYDTIGSEAIPHLPIPNWGLIDAMDTSTGRIAWHIRVPNKTVTGMTVAGDVVFFGESDGRFDAVDARNGHLLWAWKSNAPGVGGANGAPAVYTVNGREYVAMAFGGNDHERLNDKSPTGDALVVFAIGGARNGNVQVVQAHPGNVQIGGLPNSAKQSAASEPPADATVVQEEVYSYTFHPQSFAADPGEKIALHLNNAGVAPVGVAVDLPSGGVELKGKVKPHQSAYLVFTAPKQPGHYRFFDPEGPQAKMGLSGTMIVTSPSSSASAGNGSGKGQPQGSGHSG